MQNEHVFSKQLDLGSGFSMSVACWPVYQMLYGMSFELILKAIIVAKKLPVPHTHDLSKLLNKTELSFDDKTVKVLEVLSGSIVWDGRYPVPKREEDMNEYYRNIEAALYDKVLLGKLHIKKPNGALDWNRLDPLWHQLTNIFFEQINVT